MAPRKIPSVDYLRVYPGLNDFSDVLEAIPQTIGGHLTNLKEVKAKSGSIGLDVGNDIKAYFQNRNPESLRKISLVLDALLPAIGQKMHIAALAAEQVSHQVDRIDTDYRMICEHEVPESVQVQHNDPAFIEIVPQERQASIRSQARREAREAREARRATQQQDSRSVTPVSVVEPPLNPTTSRRGRGRTATPQVVANLLPAEPVRESQVNHNSLSHHAENDGALDSSVQQERLEKFAEDEVKPDFHSTNADERESRSKATQLPPVVMPLLETEQNNDKPPDSSKNDSSPAEEGGAEVIIGMKRKRGSAPKSSEPVYCYCQRGSFGEMVGCDGPHCEREWFHLDCIGLSALPKGQWFCEECRAKLRRR